MAEIASLLSRLEAAQVPLTDAIKSAMLAIPVEDYTDYDPEPFYHDRPLVFTETVEGGVKTISAPHMICTLLHHLELSEGQDVLLVGAKAGYVAALVGYIVGPEGSVTVVDPSRQVIDHVRDRLSHMEGICNFFVRKLVNVQRCPPNLPTPLNRALVTGSLPALPRWLEERIDNGGFVIAPLGGRMTQRLVKRELQAEWFDTDLGGVLFGPVDISDSERRESCVEDLAILFEEALEIGEELGVFDESQRKNLHELTESLRNLPEDAPQIQFIHDDLDEDDEEYLYIEFGDEGGEHPLISLFDSAAEWLGPIWPTLMALLETQMQHPGAPDADTDDMGFGAHRDLVP